MANNSYAVEAINLTKKFGDFTAVDGVSFQVEKGEIFAFLGPNGSGKTTTIRMLCGIISPTSFACSGPRCPAGGCPRRLPLSARRRARSVTMSWT